ncbi:MAG: chorismate synthase [Oscillospiraceae bacterium]|nr:chorismate synthase [Oscillospiraceae bacterium]
MRSTCGENLKLSIFGESHGPVVGMTLEGIPAGLAIDLEKLQVFLQRRAPGQNAWSTPRKEADLPEFSEGMQDGITNGGPITAVIHNQNTRSGDYGNVLCCPRPGHADFTSYVKYGEIFPGGGHFSGRMTAPMCIAGGMCKQWLENMGIQIGAHVLQIGTAEDEAFDAVDPRLDMVNSDFPTLSKNAGEDMQAQIAAAKKELDSLGGWIECAITGLPAGIGDPMFGGVENRIAQIVYGIPAVKGLVFGDTQNTGSENNDSFTVENSIVKTLTNHCGGILGGITNGMPVIFKVAIKPTPSIGKPQQTVNLQTGEVTTIQVKGRHDPCIVPRAVPVVEAAAAIALYDMILGTPQTDRRK